MPYSGTINSNMRDNKSHKTIAVPLVTITPDALFYLMDEEMVLILLPAGEGKINVTASKRPPEETDMYALSEQDGIHVFFHKDVSLPTDLQVRVDVKKRLFFTSLRATVEKTPTGAGFMGTRSCK